MMDMLQTVIVIIQEFQYSLFRQSEMNCTREMQIPEQNQRLSEKRIQGGTVVLGNRCDSYNKVLQLWLWLQQRQTLKFS